MAEFTDYDKIRRKFQGIKEVPKLHGHDLLDLVKKDKFDAIKEYLNCHPDEKDRSVGDDSITPLWTAARYDRQNIMNMLLKKGVDINKSISSGSTPLHAAVKYQHVKCVEILIKNGANVDARLDLFGRTPLDSAISDQQVEVVQMLVNARANLEATDDPGWTYLYRVCDNCERNLEKSLKMAEILIKGGARVNAQTRYGETPLLAALKNDRSPYLLVKMIIKSGADVDLACVSGETPLQRARRRASNEEIIALIESKSIVVRLEKQKKEQEKRMKEREERDRAKKLEQDNKNQEKQKLKNDRQNLEKLKIETEAATLERKKAEEKLKIKRLEKKIEQVSKPKTCSYYFTDAGCRYGSSCRFLHTK